MKQGILLITIIILGFIVGYLIIIKAFSLLNKYIFDGAVRQCPPKPTYASDGIISKNDKNIIVRYIAVILMTFLVGLLMYNVSEEECYRMNNEPLYLLSDRKMIFLGIGYIGILSYACLLKYLYIGKLLGIIENYISDKNLLLFQNSIRAIIFITYLIFSIFFFTTVRDTDQHAYIYPYSDFEWVMFTVVISIGYIKGSSLLLNIGSRAD